MIGVLGFDIHLYGLMIGLGMLAGGWVAARVAKLEGLDPDVVWDGLLWAGVLGIVGARLYHVADLWSYYSTHVVEIVMVWNGGLGIFGGLLGGIVGISVWIYAKVFLGKKGNYKLQITNYKKELMRLLDLGALGIPAGQAIGRWGNFFNQELYGRPTSLPWGMFINPENRLPGLEQFSRFQPLFLYESLLNLILFGLIALAYWKKSWKIGSGKYLGIYLIGYGAVRFVLEPLRVNNWQVGTVPMAWVFSITAVILGIFLMQGSYIPPKGRAGKKQNDK